MKKFTLNSLVDAFALAAFLPLVSTGVLLRYTLPPGSGMRTTVWGMDRHEWGTLHLWIALLFLAVLALHLALHWRWILSVARRRPAQASGLRAALGLIGLLAVLALAAAPLVSPVEQAERPERGLGRRGPSP